MGYISKEHGVMVYLPEHPRASPRGHVKEHHLVAEKALGKPLPPLAVVHHVDLDNTNNANNNLVICQDQTYHKLLHNRLRAFEACGHPDWRKCHFCKQYDSLNNLTVTSSRAAYHPACHAKRIREKNQEIRRRILEMRKRYYYGS